MLVIYVEDSAGETGPTGQATSMVIPLSHNGPITVDTNVSGALITTRLLGSGSASSSVAMNGNSFTLDTDTEFVFFPMPFDGKISTVSGRYSTVAPWRPTTDLSLYIAVALADNDSNTFTIVPESKAMAKPFLQTTTYDARSVRTGLADELSISVPKGKNIAVFAGYDTSGGTRNQSLPFNFSGSIAIEQA